VTRRSPSFLLCLALLGCRGSNAATPGFTPFDESESESESEAPAATISEGNAAPARARPWEPVLELLPVPDFGDAVVVRPASNERAPLLVAAHGAGGQPEFDCDHWSRLTRGEWFMLCPRGTALSDRYEGSYYYQNHFVLEREVVAMLRAARTRYADAISDEPGVYAGFSQGATMGALMVIDHGSDFRALVLVEGGWGEWTSKRARRFRETGGQSVALICGGAGCTARARQSQQILERAGLRVHVEHAEGAGHTFLGSVAERARWVFDEWPLVETDRRARER
jgi:predicted esterase